MIFVDSIEDISKNLFLNGGRDELLACFKICKYCSRICKIFTLTLVFILVLGGYLLSLHHHEQTFITIFNLIQKLQLK